MINVSLSPDPYAKKGKGGNYMYLVQWLNSIAGVAADQDASGGALKEALTSPKLDVFVTSEQYAPSSGDFTCLNVMVNRKDYRLTIGYDNQVVRVENLDARAARAQTRADVSKRAPVNTGVPSVPDNQGGVDDYGNNFMAPLGDNPYGNAPAANPYGVPIRASENPYGVPIPANN